jgi:hypothetical protein
VIKARCGIVGLTLLLAAVSWPAAARGGQPPPEPKKLKPDRYEFGGSPVLGGGSDIGFLFGALGTVARFRERYYPYRWRLEALVSLSAKASPEGGTEFPYHDDYLKLDLPGLWGGRLRLNLKAGFGRYTTSGYYGMGNAAPEGPRDPEKRRFHQYDHIYPSLEVTARQRLTRRVSLMYGLGLSYHWINPYQDSLLLDQMASSDPELQALLLGTEDHPKLEATAGVVYDSRDHEYAPQRGMFHELSGRFGPGLGADDMTYGGANLTLRAYWTLYRRYLVLAARLMADLLWGRPPFYELSRHGGLRASGAIGGFTAVRGVPVQRYHGKLKFLGNLELRSKLVDFGFWGQRFNLGLVAFADAGRVFADWGAHSQLDGNTVGIKVGLGGGLRLQWGETFVLRADVAWSPDASPVGYTVDVNHIF